MLLLIKSQRNTEELSNAEMLYLVHRYKTKDFEPLKLEKDINLKTLKELKGKVVYIPKVELLELGKNKLLALLEAIESAYDRSLVFIAVIN